MHKSATKCNETIGKWCKNKHGASKIIDTLETYQTVIYINTMPHQANFLAPLPGKKKTSARGVSHTHPLLCFSFAFTLFLLASFYQKHTKNSFLLVVIFTCLLLVLLE
jgi:hypothetical protein